MIKALENGQTTHIKLSNSHKPCGGQTDKKLIHAALPCNLQIKTKDFATTNTMLDN